MKVCDEIGPKIVYQLADMVMNVWSRDGCRKVGIK